jgi:DNA repair exonuclease SbcCD ATPase subunit
MEERRQKQEQLQELKKLKEQQEKDRQELKDQLEQQEKDRQELKDQLDSQHEFEMEEMKYEDPAELQKRWKEKLKAAEKTAQEIEELTKMLSQEPPEAFPAATDFQVDKERGQCIFTLLTLLTRQTHRKTPA